MERELIQGGAHGRAHQDRLSQKNKFTAVLDFVSHRNKNLTGIHISERKGKGQSANHIRVPRGPWKITESRIPLYVLVGLFSIGILENIIHNCLFLQIMPIFFCQTIKVVFKIQTSWTDAIISCPHSLLPHRKEDHSLSFVCSLTPRIRLASLDYLVGPEPVRSCPTLCLCLK